MRLSENTVRKYVAGLEEKGLIRTEPSTIITKDGRVRNGSLIYTIRPIQEALELNYQRQFLQVERDMERARAEKRLAELNRQNKKGGRKRMMQQLANFIVDHDPMMVLRRTHDTVRYIRWEWNKDHADPIDEDGLRLFLCDEHRGDLTDEQRAPPAGAATRCERLLRICACACCKVRSCWSVVWCRCQYLPQRILHGGGDAPWMLDRAG